MSSLPNFEFAMAPFTFLDEEFRYSPDSPSLASTPRAKGIAHLLVACVPPYKHIFAGPKRRSKRLQAELSVALEASRAGASEAHCLWSNALSRKTSEPALKRALNAPCGQHASLIEAALATRDWPSLDEIQGYLPIGTYAEGRVANTSSWFGECRHGLAHGITLASSTRLKGEWNFAGQCHEGKADGLCTWREPRLGAQLVARYEHGVRVGDATYTSSCKHKLFLDQKMMGELSVVGPWVGTGTDALPRNARCVWTLPSAGKREMRGFCGVLTVEHVASYPNSRATMEGTFTLGNGGTFVGKAWADDFKTLTGEGRLCGSDNLWAPLIGTWQRGEFCDGEGTLKLDNARYAGHLGVGPLPHGSGTLTWDSGARYEGQFVSGCLEGEGTLTWANGEHLHGNFYRTLVSPYAHRGATCDVAFGDGGGCRFAFDSRGLPNHQTLINIGTKACAP